MVVRLAMVLIFICWAHLVNFLLMGILSGDFAALSSHGLHISGPPHPCTGAGIRGAPSPITSWRLQ